jgi:hypothetical protein
MGKRELLLIVGFLVVGVVVYQVTAPAGASGGGFSFGRLIEKIRSEIRGQNYELQAKRTASVEAAPEVNTLRLEGLRGTVTITGEDRPDVSVELHAAIFGADEAQAKEFEKAVSITFEPDGETLNLRVRTRTDEMRRAPHVQLIVKAPKRLGLRLALNGGELQIAHMNAVTFDRGSGKAVLSTIAGADTGEFGGGTLEIDGAGSVDMEARRSDLRVMNVAGGVTFEVQGGDLRLRNVRGPTELSLTRVDAEVEDAGGPLKIEGTGGQVRVRNAKGAITVRVERIELSLTLSKPVPVDATTLGDTLEITLPEGGVKLEATAINGAIRASDQAIHVASAENEQRAEATLRGGGPLIKLEATRGDIVIR